jgi:hypothetical protein
LAVTEVVTTGDGDVDDGPTTDDATVLREPVVPITSVVEGDGACVITRRVCVVVSSTSRVVVVGDGVCTVEGRVRVVVSCIQGFSGTLGQLHSPSMSRGACSATPLKKEKKKKKKKKKKKTPKKWSNVNKL